MSNRTHQRKRSKQREQVLDAVRSTRSHPTADWVFHEVRKNMPRVSIATVYRDLNILSDSGEIGKIVHDGQMRFDANMDKHFHFICTSCKSIYDIPDTWVEFPDLKLPRGYAVEEVKMDFYGICPTCRRSA